MRSGTYIVGRYLSFLYIHIIYICVICKLYVCMYIYKAMLMMKLCVYIIHIIYHTNYKGKSYVREWVITEFLTIVEVFLLMFKLDSVFELG